MVDVTKVCKSVVGEGYTEVIEARYRLSARQLDARAQCWKGNGPPFVIVPGRHQQTADIEPFIRSRMVWVASSSTGWQTHETVFLWAVDFCHWLSSNYRPRLPALIQASPVLLILGGHNSRIRHISSKCSPGEEVGH
jgi:hypothetical protein